MRISQLVRALLLLVPALPALAAGPAPQDPPESKPEAVVDLMTAQGASLVAGQWRYSDARIVETQFPGPGADNQPTGAPGKTYDVEPRAGAADFDDSKWERSPRSRSRHGGGRGGSGSTGTASP